MNKKPVILFGSGKFQKKIIKILKKKFFVITVDQDAKAESSHDSDMFLNIKFNEIDKIYKFLKKKKIIPLNIISLNSDAGFIAAEKLKKKFNFSILSSKTFNIFFDKYYLLKFLKKNNFPCSKFGIFKNEKLKNFFIKPRISSGSRNIIISKKNKLTNFVNFKNYIKHKKIKGQEFVIDGFVSNKKIINFLISKKIKFHNNKTVSQIIYTNPNILSVKLKNKCLRTIKNFLLKANYHYGIFHIEFILNNDKFYIIDVAPRGPGFFVLEDYVLKHLDTRNIIDLVNNLKLKNYKIKRIFKSMLVYFLPTKKGRFKKIQIIKRLKKFKFQKFVKNNTSTSSINTDNDRLGSVILYSSNKIKIHNEIKKIKKYIKIHYY